MLTDTEAIATWERAEAADPSQASAGIPYRCVDCAWTGRGDAAYTHHRTSGHNVRGKNWPVLWGVAVFTDGGTR